MKKPVRPVAVSFTRSGKLVAVLGACGLALTACGGGGGSSSASNGNSSVPPDAPAFVSEEVPGPNGTSYAYLEPSYRLALTHQHGDDTVLFGQSLVLNNDEGLYPEFHAFDSNDWVRQKVTVDFEGWLINGVRQFDRPMWLSDLHLNTPGKAYAAYAHQSQDKLVFLSMDAQSRSGTYQLIDFRQPAGQYGSWSAIGIEGGWLLARMVRTAQAGTGGQFRLNVQVVKLDTTGRVAANRWVETANIPGFGFAQSDSSYIPFVELQKHFNDILISGFAQGMQPAIGNPLQSIQALWLAMDPNSLSLRRSFWLQADRFTRAGYNEQPQLNLWAWGTEGSAVARAWESVGTFQTTSGFNAYKDTAINQGWLRGSLSADYSSFSLTAYGLRAGAPTDNVAHYWWAPQQVQLDVRLPNNNTGTLVGNTSRVYPLPESQQPRSDCAGTAGFGRFGLSSDCRRFDSFYVFNASESMVVRNVPASLSVMSVWNSAAFGITTESNRVLYLRQPNSDKGVSLDLNPDYHHPGCTTPRTYTAPATPVLSSPEVTHVRSTELPAVMNAGFNQQGGALRVKVTPYQYRAPVLCSQYKVSLDQRLTLPRATDSQPTSAQPILHSAYNRQVLAAPTNGSYDAATNTYRPRTGFTGTDTLRLRISDGTGEQDVQVQLRVQ